MRSLFSHLLWVVLLLHYYYYYMYSILYCPLVAILIEKYRITLLLKHTKTVWIETLRKLFDLLLKLKAKRQTLLSTVFSIEIRTENRTMKPKETIRFGDSDFCLLSVWFEKRVWHFSSMHFVNETKVKVWVRTECGLNWFRSCSVCGQQIVLNFEPLREFNNWLSGGRGVRSDDLHHTWSRESLLS